VLYIGDRSDFGPYIADDPACRSRFQADRLLNLDAGLVLDLDGKDGGA
jgi:hypothetical protein